MIENHNLKLKLQDNKVLLSNIGFLEELNSGFVEVQIAGENKDSHMGSKTVNSSESRTLTYHSHQLEGNRLTVSQKNHLIQVDTYFTFYDDTNAIRIITEVTNISQSLLTLEDVTTFCVKGFGDKEAPSDWYLTEFLQSHHAECRPRRQSFRELGLFGGKSDSQQWAGHANVGSWSTKEAIPLGLIENAQSGHFMMFQIESSNSWKYEISDTAAKYYLCLSGASFPGASWYRHLAPGESYTTDAVAICFGSDLNDAIANMTHYRRHIAGVSKADEALPTIFNEYMHLSWDSPTAENTKKYAPIVAKTGVEYYVIDCGWHNEEDGDKVYPFVGHWKESNARFPNGVRQTTDYIRSLGMKPGLWIEPEIIGIQCQSMLSYYDSDCFFQRHGKKVATMNRYFLDYRNPKVREYMTQTIQRMVEQYGAEYIKCDYNQDCGTGTDLNADSAGAGLEEASAAFLDWIRQMQQQYPDVIFEGCASGGMRMDYKTLSAYSLVSTSDQTDYLLYPYIAGNILAAVLPEQAAVWSYPVASDCEKNSHISDNRITLNMINSFLGRMHLASHLDYLNEQQIALIREGVNYYNTLSPIKKLAVPYFPLGFTDFDAPAVCSGLKHKNKLYLAVWNIKNARFVHVPFTQTIENATIAYPSQTSVHLCINDRGLDVIFPEHQCAVFLEITLN